MNSAPQTDEELAREALAQFSVSGRDWSHERGVIAAACATARALGRADALAARGAASAGTPPATPAAPSAPATGEPRQGPSFTDSFFADAAFDRFNKDRPWSYATFMGAVTEACAAARAQQRDKAGDLERVAAALWRAWWRTHGESESEILFAQLYEGARARWLEIARAGFAAREARR